MQIGQLWTYHFRRFWVEDRFIEPYHPDQNLLQRETAQRENIRKKIMIDQNVDIQGCFKVMDHVADLHNYKAHLGNKNYLPPITGATIDIGYISLINDFHFNEEVLYKESITRLPDSGGNGKTRPLVWMKK